ncbi:hypothetical protein JF66_13580, partial [Cryobacterium sp. MLB-32]|uniref:hypothetical protein n=1 Tax=Cryobacterium sp. MLB-32 TaxID=1529318 RepID=UPI0004E6AD2A
MTTPRFLKHALVLVALSVLTAALLSGCAGAPPSPARDFESQIGPSWTVTAGLIGAPIAANGVVVSYVSASDGGLQIVAWDAHSGVELWRDDAATGSMTTGVELDASIVETDGRTLVPYVRDLPDNDSDWQQLVIADAVTGIAVAVAPSAVWASERPTACPDGAGICFSGWTFDARLAGQRSFRFDPKVGTVRPDTDLALPDGARFLGERIFSTSLRAPEGLEMLGYSAAGKTAWQRPYTEVFGRGYSSDGGWSWEKSDPDGLLIGSGATYEPGLSDREQYSYDLTEQRVVALSRETGETV